MTLRVAKGYRFAEGAEGFDGMVINSHRMKSATITKGDRGLLMRWGRVRKVSVTFRDLSFSLRRF